MKSERVFDLVVWLLIAAVGLTAAYVCFGILSSTASGQFKEYSVGGAIAGALVSWGVLTSVFLQLRGSSNELQELKERAEQLQQKLIRGAPRPEGFESEVDERQRIVLARPKDWMPKGGTIFELELPEESMRTGDSFPATFRCYFEPIEKSSKSAHETYEEGYTPKRQKYYDSVLKSFKDATEGPNAWVVSFSSEVVRLGGELSSVESLKFIARQMVKIRTGPSRDTGKVERNWWLVSRDEFAGRISGIVPSSVRVGQAEKVRLWGWSYRKGVICYVDGQKRETEMVGQDQLYLTLHPEDVAYSRTLEIAFENSDTGGLRSNAVTLFVTSESSGDQASARIQEDTSADETMQKAATSASITATEQNEEQKQEAQESQAQRSETEGTEKDQVKLQETQDVYQQVERMQVVCYNHKLEKVYVFDFWDDVEDFVASSAVFNQIIASTRFLD